MKRILTAVVLALSSLVAGNAHADISIGTPASARYEMVLTDGFDGATVDRSKWFLYDSTPKVPLLERGIGPARFEAEAVSVESGNLTMRATVQGGVPIAAALVPRHAPFRYGRYEFAMNVETTGPAWHVASLLWPDARPGKNAGSQADGEVDWPEGTADKNASIFVHKTGATPWQTCWSLGGAWPMTGWHAYRIDWTPTALIFWRDGQVVGQTSCMQPQFTERWILQVVTLNATPPAWSTATVRVDWVNIYRQVGT